MNYAEIAAKNYANRRAQLARLRPKLTEARTNAEELRKAQDGAGTIRQAMETMSRLKHIPGFFPTPRALVQRMIEEARLEPGKTVLEPSAGKGDIALAARTIGAKVHCIEKNHNLVEHLKKQGLEAECGDFLTFFPDPRNRLKFDCVLMNPPFEHHEDAKHVQHAFNFLAPRGRLVAIVCSVTGAKLQPWIDEKGGTVEQLPAGSFANSERPTNVNTCLIVI